MADQLFIVSVGYCHTMRHVTGGGVVGRAVCGADPGMGQTHGPAAASPQGRCEACQKPRCPDCQMLGQPGVVVQ